MNWSEFFHMGGYGFYVWTSWALTVVIFVWHLAQVKLVRRQLRESLSRDQRRQQIATDSSSNSK